MRLTRGIKLTIINKIIFINKSPAHFYRPRLQLKSLNKNKEKVKHSQTINIIQAATCKYTCKSFILQEVPKVVHDIRVQISSTDLL